jgi:hypothetical protein
LVFPDDIQDVIHAWNVEDLRDGDGIERAVIAAAASMLKAMSSLGPMVAFYKFSRLTNLV